MRLALSGFCLGLALLASAATVDHSVNELMQDLGNTMLRMLPAAYSETPDRTLLLENLVRLEYLLKKAAPHFTETSNIANVTLPFLQQRLAEAREFGTGQNTAMLQSTISDAFTLCATCHVQDRVTHRAFGDSRINELDKYLAVEYSFLTRDYAAAIASSQNYFKHGERSKQRDSIVLQRILMIGVEVRRDFAFTNKQLSTVLPYLGETDYNLTRVKDWMTVLTRLQTDRDTLQSPVGSSLRSLDRFLNREWPEIRTLLSFSQQEAYWVVVRGELNRHLQAEPGRRNLPRIYYWLAVIDRELQYRFYGSLSHAYLEACMIDFPSDPYATRCLDEYEFLVLISFSGSSGTHVPPEVLERLNEMRKLIVSHRR